MWMHFKTAKASEQTGLQEAHSTVHESGQNLGHTCTRL
ncbi:unnamed protein product, partial [Vitis vinifera]|uniref:Uncharacterized protein n=1 Tax=Vitis vinifera TaxID=29760 RepID=D7UC11_VITVI